MVNTRRGVAVILFLALLPSCAAVGDMVAQEEASSEGRAVAITAQYLSGGDIEPGGSLGLYGFRSDGVGMFMQLKGLLTGSEPHLDALGPGAFGDPETDRFTEGYAFNVGATLQPTDYLGLYAGLGYAETIEIIEQFDPSFILSPSGSYYVSGEDDAGLNVVVGGLLLLDPVAIDICYDSFLESYSIGVGYCYRW